MFTFCESAYARGNCTLPNKCTCFCKGFYDADLCAVYGGDYCNYPFQDPLFRYRTALKPNEVFGTRRCWSGYEGAVDETDAFRSCHLKIYEPDYITRNSVAFLWWGTILFFIIIVLCVCVRNKFRRRFMVLMIQQRMNRQFTRSGRDAFKFRIIGDDAEQKELKSH